MLDLSVANHEIKINGNDVVMKDRNRHGGGVVIYIRNSINYTVRDGLSDESLEAVTLEISKPKSKPFLINSWYRPPDTTLELFNIYDDLTARMDSENEEVVLIGDFCCDWTRLINNRSNALTNKLAEIAKTFN